MKPISIRIAAALAALTLTALAGVCPIPGPKPVNPVGCKDMRSVCECDEKGNNCKIKWVCVPD